MITLVQIKIKSDNITRMIIISGDFYLIIINKWDLENVIPQAMIKIAIFWNLIVLFIHTI